MTAPLPRIVIDGRMVGPVPHGFGRYVSHLAQGLAEIRETLPLAYEPVFLIHGESVPEAFKGFATCRLGAGFLNPLEMLEIPTVLSRLGAAAYHSPTFASLPYSPCPWVSSVYDLNHLQYGGFKQRLYYRSLLRPFMLKAKVLTTISAFSRSEIASWTGIPAEKIEVVDVAIDPGFHSRVAPALVGPVLERHSLRLGRYFFCLSNPKPHKNLKTLLEAYAKYRDQCRTPEPWDLVLNLKPGQLEGTESPGVRLIGPPTDAEVRALMTGSGAVVFPSTYEGFGLPPVEAACLGAPIIVSRIPAHLEGLRDLKPDEVRWVEATDVQGWTQALGSTDDLRGVSSNSRFAIINRFSVAKMGAHMDRLYRRVLSLL